MVDDSEGSQREMGLGVSSCRRLEKKGDVLQRSWRLTLKGCFLAPTRMVVIWVCVCCSVLEEEGGGGRDFSRLDDDDDFDVWCWCWRCRGDRKRLMGTIAYGGCLSMTNGNELNF